MKRSSTQIPDQPAAARRKRSLSEEERALWESVANQAKPLRQGTRLPKSAADKPHVLDKPAVVKMAASVKPNPSARALRAPPTEPPPLAPLARRERTRLSRGKKQIQARLDLHGMTQTHAHRELSAFLQRAHRDGLTFVLVITGKGKIGAESERGVLRRHVPQWLALPEFRSLVVGFDQAHIGHGGEGALYVRLRRART
jgi:DNA-nicking Smr family endonuclease